MNRLLLVLLLCLGLISQAIALTSTTATVVYGQAGSFTTNELNNGGISPNTLFYPNGATVDIAGGLYVADYANNRVLHYPAGSTTADQVYGQGGSFTTKILNNGGISANSLFYPIAVTVDSSGGLYIADYANNRVLHYPAGSTTADRVYGQGGSFTSNTGNTGGLSANSLSFPTAVALDSSGGLYVADYFSSRVLHYPAGSTTADRVYGQGGSFTTNEVNNGGISANSLFGPMGLAVDSTDGLYVVDYFNHRVLHYPAGSTTADRVYGQGGSFTTNTDNNDGLSANSLFYPTAATVDSDGELYVADYNNNRVLHYPAGSTTADRVYGQNGSFTANDVNNGGLSANSLFGPMGLAVDSTGGLYVVDGDNMRVLYYAALAVPSISSVSPSAGPTAGGTAITLTGLNFTGATGITVGGTACSAFNVTSDTTATCTTPAGTAGKASVLVTTPGGTSAATAVFTYTASPNPIPTLGEWTQIMMILKHDGNDWLE